MPQSHPQRHLLGHREAECFLYYRGTATRSILSDVLHSIAQLGFFTVVRCSSHQPTSFQDAINESMSMWSKRVKIIHSPTRRRVSEIYLIDNIFSFSTSIMNCTTSGFNERLQLLLPTNVTVPDFRKGCVQHRQCMSLP